MVQLQDFGRFRFGVLHRLGLFPDKALRLRVLVHIGQAASLCSPGGFPQPALTLTPHLDLVANLFKFSHGLGNPVPPADVIVQLQLQLAL